MLRMSAKAVFDDHLAQDELLIKHAVSYLPYEFVRRFKKNVTPITPMKRGWLRRSIVTQVSGDRASIGWRAGYAPDQEAGRDLKTGHIYRHYTTPGTGPGFAQKALHKTYGELGQMARQARLTK